MFGRIVVDFSDFDFTLFECLQNRVDHHARGLAVRNFGHGQRLVVNLLDFGSHLHCASALTVVITAHIDKASRRKIGIKRELLTAQISHTSIENLIEVMRQNLRRQTYGNTLHSLKKQ